MTEWTKEARPLAWLVKPVFSRARGSVFLSEPDFGNVGVWDSKGYEVTPLYPATALSSAFEAGRKEAEEKMAVLLKDPAAVRVNYLRGDIACQNLIDEAVASGREEEREACAEVAKCHSDDRPGRDRNFDWNDGYIDGCRGAAAAIRSREGKE